MYNEYLKKRYIDKKESEVVLAPNFLKNTFTKTEPFDEYYGAAVPPVRWWRSHLSGLSEPPRFVVDC